jgi:hypothetical protein
MLITRVSAAAAVALVAAAIVPAAGPASASSSKCPQVRVRQTTAVRYDPDPRSRIVRTDRRGTVEKTCLTAIGRGEQYLACGRRGWDWYLVAGGFIPDVCAEKL